MLAFIKTTLYLCLRKTERKPFEKRNAKSITANLRKEFFKTKQYDEKE